MFSSKSVAAVGMTAVLSGTFLCLGTAPASAASAASCPATPYQNGPTVIVSASVAAGGTTITVQGCGLPPGTTVQIMLFSTPVLLGTATVGPNGELVATVTIPADVECGPHRLVLLGPGGQVLAEAIINITEPCEPTAEQGAINNNGNNNYYGGDVPDGGINNEGDNNYYGGFPWRRGEWDSGFSRFRGSSFQGLSAPDKSATVERATDRPTTKVKLIAQHDVKHGAAPTVRLAAPQEGSSLLPRTGADVAGLALVGTAMLGGGALLVARRRRSAN